MDKAFWRRIAVLVRWWLDNLLSRGVQFDVIGLSCNDTGPPENWKANFEDLAALPPVRLDGRRVSYAQMSKGYANLGTNRPDHD